MNSSNESDEYEEIYVVARFPELEGLLNLDKNASSIEIVVDSAATSAQCTVNEKYQFEGQFELNLGSSLAFSVRTNEKQKKLVQFECSSLTTLPLKLKDVTGVQMSSNQQTTTR